MMPRNALILAAGISVLGACAIEEIDARAPKLRGMSRDSIRVGQDLQFTGAGFLEGADGQTLIELAGEYVTEDGRREPIDMRIRPAVVEGQLLWRYFGPFDIPFSETGRELGVLEGTATAINVGATQEESASEPLPIQLRVLPSILVTGLAPVAADCATPATRLLGGFGYRVQVEAVGIAPTDFTLEVLDEPGAAPRVYQSAANGNAAVFGDSEELRLASVPDELALYVNRIAVTARGADGASTAAEYSFGVHRPLEYVASSSSALAEVEAPRPVSGCISGGDAEGRAVTYTGPLSDDVRDRQVSFHWDETWLENPGSHDERHPVDLTVDPTTGASSAQWTDGTVTTELLIADAVEWGARHLIDEGSGGWSVAGESTLWSAEGLVSADDDFWTTSSADSLSGDRTVQIPPGQFGVWYLQTSRLRRPGAVVSYNLCGIPEVVGQAELVDYQWTVAMGQGSECPPLPQPDLPPAECLLPPCSGS
jgi:hypothetical protein